MSVQGLGGFISSAWNKMTSTTSGKAAVAVGITATALLLGGCAYKYFTSNNDSQRFQIREMREAVSRLPDFSDEKEAYVNTATKTIQVSSEILSFEEGDEKLLYDNSMNSIPGTCFEIGAALSILESPGYAGHIMDGFAGNLSQSLNAIYHTELGDTEVLHNGTVKTLREVFDQKLLKEVRPSSDQIGRCTSSDLEEDWYAGEGLNWLQGELNMPSDDPRYSQNNMLTKVRMISAFGTVMRELIPVEGNEKALSYALGKDFEVLQQRYDGIVKTLRHKDFDNPVTRARSERPPIIDGVSVGTRPLQDASSLNIGFGRVYGPESFRDDPDLLERYNQTEDAKGGRQGLEREGQPINDSSRPGVVSEYGLERMSQDFKEGGLPSLLKSKAFDHGTGVNRWQVNGTYAKRYCQMLCLSV